MDYDMIETPENVILKRKLAGLGTRMIAGIIDMLFVTVGYLILFALFAGIFVVTGVVSGSGFEGVLSAVLFVLVAVSSFLLYWGYFFLFEYFMNGQTPGKRSAKIRVVQDDGRPLSFTSVAVRNLLRIVDGIGSYAVGIFVMFCTKKEQRLGDLAAGTIVISEEISEYNARTDNKNESLKENFEQIESDVIDSILSPSEYRLLHNYWIRRQQLDLDARRRVLEKLLAATVRNHPIHNLPLKETLEENTIEELEQVVEELLAAANQANTTPVPAPPSDPEPTEDALS